MSWFIGLAALGLIIGAVFGNPLMGLGIGIGAFLVVVLATILGGVLIFAAIIAIFDGITGNKTTGTPKVKSKPWW